MKKFFSLLLALTMVLSLGACGASQNAESASETTAAPEGVPATKTDEWPAITIEYWNINNESAGGATVEYLVEEFNKTNDKNITVINRFVADQYAGIARDLQSSLAAGIYPGVMQVGWNYLNYFADNFPQFTGPDEIVEKYAPEDKEYLQNTFTDNVRNLATAVNGRLVGLPYSMSVPLLFINDEIFEAAGLDPKSPPSTWEELIEAARTIKEKTGNYGFYMQAPSDIWVNYATMLSNGVKMYEMNEGQAVATFDCAENVEVWQTLQDVYKEGLSVNVPYDEGRGGFVGGKFGMCLTTVASKGYFASNAEFPISTAVFPKFNENRDVTVCVGGNFLMCVGKTDDQIRACWEFMKFLYESENAARWTMDTGYLPAPKDIQETNETLKKYIAENEIVRPAFDSIEYAVPWVSWPGAKGLQVEQVMVDMRDAILSSFEDVPTALNNAEDTVNKLLAG